MTQKNHLAGIACPECSHAKDFDIEVLATSRVSQAGPQRLHGKCEWHEDSRITCPSCGAKGKVSDFRQASPSSIIHVAIQSNVFQSPSFIEDEAGFCVRVMSEWYRDESNAGVRETADQLAEVKALHAFYVRYHRTLGLGFAAGDDPGKAKQHILQVLRDTNSVTDASAALDAVSKNAMSETYTRLFSGAKQR